MKRNLRFMVLLLLAWVTTSASAEEYSYVFNDGAFTGQGTEALGSVDWTIQAPGDLYWGYGSDKGQQIGSARKPAKTITLSTNGITENVSQIVVETSGANSISAMLEVSVGGTAYTTTGGNAYNLTNTSTEATFTGSAAGEIKLVYTNMSAKAIYIKAIKVYYGEGGSGETIEPKPEEIVSVKSIAELNALEDGQLAALYLSDEANARVTFAYDKYTYLRDNTGAVCLYNIDKKMTYNQHVAGYITGKKTVIGNMPAFTATPNTTAFMLIAADPVTEPNVEPIETTAAELSGHYADWVSVKNVKMADGQQGQDATGSVNVVNTFNISEYADIQSGKEYNIYGIVNSTTDGDLNLSPIHNVANKRTGNPSADMEADFLPLTLTSTGIHQMNMEQNKNTTVYDLMGRKVSPSHMTKGVYIINGKKYVK
ncbi:MAG: hypothetical protein ACOYJK_09655 [Prevotella sp.]|jgi:LEA14-like dessication related protein